MANPVESHTRRSRALGAMMHFLLLPHQTKKKKKKKERTIYTGMTSQTVNIDTGLCDDVIQHSTLQTFIVGAAPLVCMGGTHVVQLLGDQVASLLQPLSILVQHCQPTIVACQLPIHVYSSAIKHTLSASKPHCLLHPDLRLQGEQIWGLKESR